MSENSTDFYENLYNHPLNQVLFMSSWLVGQLLGNALLVSVIIHERNNQYRTMLGYIWSQVRIFKLHTQTHVQ